MYKDKIVEEVRKTREKFFEEFDFDIRKLSDFIYEDQKNHKDKLVTQPFSKPKSSDAKLCAE